MKCPFCSHVENRVLDSRLSQDGHAIRRRRECIDCARRFTTYERVESTLSLVYKKDGRREQFDRDKVKSGILTACEKRPVGIDIIERFVDELERKLPEQWDREVPSHSIGEQVMDFLQGIDEVAYVRFASVYRSFRDVRQFMSEMQELIERKGTEPSKGSKAEDLTT